MSTRKMRKERMKDQEVLGSYRMKHQTYTNKTVKKRNKKMRTLDGVNSKRKKIK